MAGSLSFAPGGRQGQEHSGKCSSAFPCQHPPMEGRKYLIFIPFCTPCQGWMSCLAPGQLDLGMESRPRACFQWESLCLGHSLLRRESQGSKSEGSWGCPMP